MYTVYEKEGKGYVLVRDICKVHYRSQYKNTPRTAKVLLQQGVKVTKTKIKIGKFTKCVYCIPSSECNFADQILNEHKMSSELPGLEEGGNNLDPTVTFYIAQKYPEYAPQIIKMGMTSRSVEQRLREFNVYDIKLLRQKKTKASFERTLIDMIGAKNKYLGEEEFWVEDMDSFLERADKVFAFLPD